jgi:hypothetical protein
MKRSCFQGLGRDYHIAAWRNVWSLVTNLAVHCKYFSPLCKGLCSMLRLSKIFASGHSASLYHVTNSLVIINWSKVLMAVLFTRLNSKCGELRDHCSVQLSSEMARSWSSPDLKYGEHRKLGTGKVGFWIEVAVSNFCRDTDYSGSGFFWFSSAPGVYQVRTLTWSMAVFLTSFPFHHSFIILKLSCQILRATDTVVKYSINK